MKRIVFINFLFLAVSLNAMEIADYNYTEADMFEPIKENEQGHSGILNWIKVNPKKAAVAIVSAAAILGLGAYGIYKFKNKEGSSKNDNEVPKKKHSKEDLKKIDKAASDLAKKPEGFYLHLLFNNKLKDASGFEGNLIGLDISISKEDAKSLLSDAYKQMDVSKKTNIKRSLPIKVIDYLSKEHPDKLSKFQDMDYHNFSAAVKFLSDAGNDTLIDINKQLSGKASNEPIAPQVGTNFKGAKLPKEKWEILVEAVSKVKNQK